ncbi:MAG: DUF87 domain-containing protein [Candidatus Pacebacteria bacterium]|nr:DUF87 domain-containing protein [Candidatus Paceibacterota bacterium]
MFYYYFSFLILIILFVVIFKNKKKKFSNILQSLDMVLFSIRIPKFEKKDDLSPQKERKEIIASMEQVFSSFLNLKTKGVPRIVFEIASEQGGTDIEFYVAVPNELASSLEKYIQGVYPLAQVSKVSRDYTIFEPDSKTAGAYLKLRETNFLPINTYVSLAQDPIASITNALSKIKPEEGVALQLILKPFKYTVFQKQGNKIISLLKKGKDLSLAIRDSQKSETKKTLESFQKKEEKKENPVDEFSIEVIQNKIKKPLFETNIRIIASAKTQERAKEILSYLEASFGQFSSSNSFNAFYVKAKRIKNFIYNFSFRNFNPLEKNVLNLEEITSIFHLPTSSLESPNIKWVTSGEVTPPTNLPKSGDLLLGNVIYRSEENPVYCASAEDRRRHFYVIGQTGTGKSSLLQEYIRQDIKNGKGVGVIDPHGDLIENTLASIPPERIDDVVLFEPFYTERPVGLNMLEYDTLDQKDFAVQEMIAIFQKLFPPEITGPMFEHYMRNAMLALMANKNDPGTLVEIPRLFTDTEFMEERLASITDPVVRLFWEKEWKQTTGSTRSDMLGYVVSKLGRFIENEMLRNIIGQAKSGFDLAKIMNEGKIFLANLSKGRTGEVSSSLLGLILVSKMQMAAMKRADMLEQNRKDFYLYIDEFQNFTTDSVATILSEARKYRLNLILAHQYIPQVADEIKNAVMGNVGSMAIYRVGADDAEFLENKFAPYFSKYDFVNIDNYNCIIRMMINGSVSTPFKLKALKPKEGNKEIINPLKELSRLKYGKSKQEVEKEILRRSRLDTIG